ncbi:CobW family GTP-binding protein [Halalkalibacterium halodurans]|uniref:CobW family GTP-binding protein n=1 Tax=Halalkalibacterium halodurans TaxID=86665 RepID=UPI002AAA2EF6|nr:GTP-binding protein [Halalkalibacterium halodurans]MDY7222040.1 GTP-binding protein [Halalkalibacterium halodurans]MDY7241316.1 GTP-binding protein [Halalkalibacterium halodurans]
MIPVYLFSGFLGSGKTTVLLNVLNQLKEDGLRPAIVLNEAGEMNVEKELFANETVVELLNGCICCTIQDDLKAELQRFLTINDRSVDVLLIEGTGIANPREIIEVLTDPPFIEQLALQSVIGIIDASRYLEYRSLFSSSKEIRAVLKEQVAESTLLLLNKQDLVDGRTLHKVEEKLKKDKKPGATILSCSYGKVPTEELLKPRIKVDTGKDHAYSVAASSHASHSHHHHHHDIQAIKLDLEQPVTEKELQRWLIDQGDQLIRAKGYVRLQGNDLLVHFQYASKQLSVRKSKEEVPPCLILIGVDLNRETLAKSLHTVTNV